MIWSILIVIALWSLYCYWVLGWLQMATEGESDE
jgi:hypothetical protein